MFRVWTKKIGRVGKSESHVYFLALTCSDAEQSGKPFLLKGNFIRFILNIHVTVPFVGVCVPFPLNSILSVHKHRLFIYLIFLILSTDECTSLNRIFAIRYL